MDRHTIKLFMEEFAKRIDKKPSWGKDQIKQLAIITLNDVLLGNLDKEQSENTQN